MSKQTRTAGATTEEINNQKDRFSKIYEEHADAVFRFASYKLSDREKAKDIVQESFVKLWEYMSSDETVDNPKALLFRIASNSIVDNYRKHKDISLDVLTSDGFDPADHSQAERIVEQSEGKIALKLLNKLEEPLRDLLLMRYVDGLSVKEIAEIQKERENTVSVRLHRAMKELRELFEQNSEN
ncbi:MAG: RNA polymerase sigma factor [Patescibacteria group bacterium]